MNLKSRYSPEDIERRLKSIKEKAKTLGDHVFFTTGIKYNIWLVYDGELDPDDLRRLIWVNYDDHFYGKIFGKQQTILMFMPEFD